MSSYPHPWLMPDYWTFPTVSMGLAPIMSIYQARFNRYLEDRKLKEPGNGKVWAFLGDGETDEPETLGAIKFAAREKLDTSSGSSIATCNVWTARLRQRADYPGARGYLPRRGLERYQSGVGFRVGQAAFERHRGRPHRPLPAPRDGESQRYAAFGAPELREHFFDTPELKKLIEGWSDADIAKLNRGGHDPVKVYAAYKRATEHEGSPTVILARTVKGYGLGESGEGKNVTHQQKNLTRTSSSASATASTSPSRTRTSATSPFTSPKKTARSTST